MARWEPDARQRLVAAALDLFTEQGYDDTTVAQIADRAGLTKSTFFRHFPDKREVLVAGQDTLCRLLAEGIAAAPESATPLEAVGAAPEAAATASLAAELGVLALRRASARWTDPANDRPLGDLARQSLQELRAASAAL